MRRRCATLFQFASSAWELLELLGFQGEELLLALFARPTAPLREPEGWPPESFVFWDIYTMSWQKEDKVSKDNSKDLFQPAPCSHTSPLHGGLLRHHPLHLPLRITVPDPDKPWSSHRDPSLPDPASQCHRHPSPLLTLFSYLLSAGANPVRRHFQCSLRSVCFALPPPTVAPRVSGRVGGGGGCYCAVRRLLVGTWRRWKWQLPPFPPQSSPNLTTATPQSQSPVWLVTQKLKSWTTISPFCFSHEIQSWSQFLLQKEKLTFICSNVSDKIYLAFSYSFRKSVSDPGWMTHQSRRREHKRSHARSQPEVQKTLQL